MMQKTTPGFAALALALGIGAAALLIACVMSAVLLRTKCPRCGFSLRKVISRGGSPTLPKLDACPHCGVSLDEPMEETAGSS